MDKSPTRLNDSLNKSPDKFRGLTRSGGSSKRWFFFFLFALFLAAAVYEGRLMNPVNTVSHDQSHGGKAKDGASSGAPVPVVVSQVGTASIPNALAALGTVVPVASITLKSQAEGKVVAIHIHEGQLVQKGDLLFTIDPRPFQTNVAQSRAVVGEDTAKIAQAQANLKRDLAQVNVAKAMLEKDEAQLQLAQVQQNRYTRLLRDEFISQQEYDQTATNRAAALATVRADRAAVDNARALVNSDSAAITQAQANKQADQAAEANSRLNLSYAYIRSPMTGKTGALSVHIGDTVKLNDTVLITIAQLQPIDIQFNVPEKQIGLIRQYQPQIQVIANPAAVSDQNNAIHNPPGSEKQEYGKLIFINNQADPNTGTILLKARFENADNVLWPGQYIPLNLILSQGVQSVVVPSQAIQTGQQGDYVFVVDHARHAQYRLVKTGNTYQGMTSILEGLTAGETVITDGQLLVAPNMPVKIKQSH